MIKNRYKGLRRIKTQLKQIRFLSNAYYNTMYKIIISEFMQKEASNDTRLFRYIEIETINRCNGECSFCPVNKYQDKRPIRIMDMNLFRKIIDDLAQLNYTGDLALYSNNEPFLDKEIVERAEYARVKLPTAFIHLYTNGSILDRETFNRIIPYLSRLVIDNYNDDLTLNETSKWVEELCKADSELNKKVEIHIRKQHEVLYTRGGQAPNYSGNIKTPNITCPHPFDQMVIRPDGKVSLCCNDALGRYTLGDCNNQSIYDIWNSDIYWKIRKKIRDGRKALELCKECDTLPPYK